MDESMVTESKLRKGVAYRQYLAVVDEINSLVGQGYDLKEIHRQLTSEEKITMSYQALWENINRGKKKKQRKTVTEPEESPLFTQQVLPIPQMVPSQPNLEPPGSHQVSIESQEPAVSQKPARPPLLPPVLAPNSSAEARRKAVQESLKNNLKANEQFMNNASSDPEFEREAERLAGIKE